ncbi:MAG: hypothetical protein ACLFWD_01015 [Anaerolineales bacterium]
MSQTRDSQARQDIFAIALLAWVFLVLSAYYVVHKPWPATGAVAGLNAILDIVLGFALIFLAGGIGRRLLGVLSPLHPHEALAAQMGAGLGALSLLALALGAAGWFNRWVAWFLLLPGLLLFLRPGLDWFRNLSRGWPRPLPSGALSKVSMVGIGLLLLFSLLIAAAPPLKWDALVYHLVLPKHYLQSGQIGFVSGNLFSGFPQLAEMLYMWALALRAGSTAALVGWWVGVIGILGLAGLGHRLFGKRGWWLGPVILIAGASLWRGLAWAYVDHWVLLYGVILLSVLTISPEIRDGPWLWLAGAAVGFGMSVKYTGGLLLIAVAGWYTLEAWEQWRDGAQEEPTSSPIRSFLIVAAIGFVLFCPWLLKNWLTVGNPLYPFIWPGGEVDSLRQGFHILAGESPGILHILLLPWRATVLGVEGASGFSASIGPLYLALIPGRFLVRNTDAGSQRTITRKLAWIALLAWLLWGLAWLIAEPFIQSRLYYGLFPVLAMVAAAGFLRMNSLEAYGVKIGWVISKLILFIVLLTLVSAIFHFGSIDPLRVLTGEQSEQDYIAEHLGWYGPVMEYLDGLPSDSRVEMLWEARSYQCLGYCYPDEILDKWWYWRRTVVEGELIADSLRDQGVTHILIYDFGASFEQKNNDAFQPEDWRALEAFKEEQLELLKSFGNAYSLYVLASK